MKIRNQNLNSRNYAEKGNRGSKVSSQLALDSQHCSEKKEAKTVSLDQFCGPIQGLPNC